MAKTSVSTPPVRGRAPVVVHRPQRGRSFSLLYLVPAAFMSGLFHVCLFGAMFLLNSPNQAPATEKALLATAAAAPVIKAEQPPPPPPEPENRSADPLLIPANEVDPSVPDQEPELNFENKNLADVAVPGLEKPGEKIGFEGAPDSTPFDVPPPAGLGGVLGGQGGDFANVLSGGLETMGNAGGFGAAGVPLDNKIFGGRSGAGKALALREGEATEASEAAVNAGLIFLAKIQQPDGRWRLDTRSFGIVEKDKSVRTVNIPDPGHANDVAATAFGLLPYFAAGKTHKKGDDNPFDKPIEKALAWLIRNQNKKNGNLGGGMYAHGLATIALCEAYGLSKDPILKRPAQDAINFIVMAQHDQGGWRYAPKQPGDTSVVGWMIMALKSGQLAGLDVPEVTISKAINYLDGACDPNSEGYGYVGPGRSPTMSAVGLLCRQYLQFWGPNNPRMMKGVDMNIKTHPPGAHRNMYYYYYATQVMHHFGGQSWKSWNEKMRDSLVARQVKTGDLAGSWDSRGDSHGHAGGRLMETSLSLLTLEVYYRHLPLFGGRKD